MSPAPSFIEIEGQNVPLRLRVNKRARRLIMRIDADERGVVVTYPKGVAKAEAVDFARDRAGWIKAGLDKLPPKVAFQPGASLPYLDREHVIRHLPASRLGVMRENGEILIGGRPEHLARRLTDWLKRQAKAEIALRAGAMAERLDCKLGRISVRDTRSRWGSCAPSGNLSFCWRLVMAPESVLDYVIAHEVTHRLHMDHGREFWAVVAGLGVDVKGGRAWLNREGENLRRYG
ncbi:MAG: SprT family zinc-dependent metalloprotease [Rhodospirillales bacterium]|nr:SprT family zinc-dependent metalloprotease [Rhodospirillales bacterium]